MIKLVFIHASGMEKDIFLVCRQVDRIYSGFETQQYMTILVNMREKNRRIHTLYSIV